MKILGCRATLVLPSRELRRVIVLSDHLLDDNQRDEL